MTDQRKYTSKLVDKHVLIIGGSSGIGYGVAEACLEQGARVTISSSNPTRVSDAVARLSAAYPSAAAAQRITSVTCDLSNEATLEANVTALFDSVASAHALNHVVFTAGDALGPMPLSDATVANIKQTGMVRFFGALICAREAAKHLPKSPDSSFTITSSTIGDRPMPGRVVVGSFAAGHFSMTRALALDLKPIRVNCVAPGAVDTELWNTLSEEQRQSLYIRLTNMMPTGRVGRVEDVAEAYLYLLKDTNITGSVISTNGGALLV